MSTFTPVLEKAVGSEFEAMYLAKKESVKLQQGKMVKEGLDPRIVRTVHESYRTVDFIPESVVKVQLVRPGCTHELAGMYAQVNDGDLSWVDSWSNATNRGTDKGDADVIKAVYETNRDDSRPSRGVIRGELKHTVLVELLAIACADMYGEKAERCIDDKTAGFYTCFSAVEELLESRSDLRYMTKQVDSGNANQWIKTQGLPLTLRKINRLNDLVHSIYVDYLQRGLLN